MKPEWFYASDGRQHGPILATELKELVQQGKILQSDLVWKEGMKNWKQAATIKGLFPTAHASGPPPLSMVSDDEGGILHRLSVWLTFGSSLPQTLAFQTPWEPTERITPNRSDLYCAIAAIPISMIILVSLPIGLLFHEAFGIAAYFGLLLMALIFGKYIWGLSMNLPGRWVMENDDHQWIEFLGNNVLRRFDGTTASWTLLRNRGFIDFAEKGVVTDSWKVLQSSGSVLEVLDRNGVIHTFKKGKTLAEEEAANARLNPLNLIPFGSRQTNDAVPNSEPTQSAESLGPRPSSSPDLVSATKDRSAGILSNIWNWVTGKPACPHCRSRDGEEISSTPMDSLQEWRADYARSRNYNEPPPQAVFNVAHYHVRRRCNNCRHEWDYTTTSVRRA
jgi:hypothetical protein